MTNEFEPPQLRQYSKGDLYLQLKEMGVLSWSYSSFRSWMYSAVFPEANSNLKSRKFLMPREVQQIFDELDIDYRTI